MERIFVYGSLRTDMYNFDTYLKDKVIQSTRAYVKGSLYTIKGARYPALIEGHDLTVGEIMEVEDPAIWDVLDELEEYISEGNIHNEYDRLRTAIYDEQLHVVDYLDVYFFNMRKNSHQEILGEKIIHGDYVTYIQDHNK